MATQTSNYRPLVADKPLVWLMAIIVPFALFFYLSHLDFARDTAIFLAIVSLTLISWMFSLTADFIPALLALLLLLLFGLVPSRVALSGFSSDGFLIAFSVMGLGAVISTSGLARRYTLWLLKTIPANTFAYQAAVFFTGFLLNPVVPTITARAVITAPILNNMVDHLDPPAREKSSTLLYLSGLDGINLLSPIFLTAALGIVTAPLHKISIPLVTFTIICFLLVLGALDRKTFIEKIDWAFFFLLAAMIGFMASMNYMGLDKLLVAQFDGFKDFMRLDFEKFVLVLTLVTLVVRMFIPLNSAILILVKLGAIYASIPFWRNIGVL